MAVYFDIPCVPPRLCAPSALSRSQSVYPCVREAGVSAMLLLEFLAVARGYGSLRLTLVYRNKNVVVERVVI